MEMPAEVVGDGRPLVLVGGGLTGWASWAPFAERLSESRQVVRLQPLSVQLGLDGAPLPEDYSPAMEKAAMERTLASLQQSHGLVSPADFAGWSYGGSIILDFAQDHPEWVRTMTLIEPGAAWLLGQPDGEAQRELTPSLGLSREDVTEEDLVRFLQAAALVPKGEDPRESPQWPVWARHRQSLRAEPLTVEYTGNPKPLAELSTPTLLIKGTGSAHWLHQVVDMLAERLPNVQVVEWSGGHAAHIENMDAFLEQMAWFQDRVSGEP